MYIWNVAAMLRAAKPWGFYMKAVITLKNIFGREVNYTYSLTEADWYEFPDKVENLDFFMVKFYREDGIFVEMVARGYHID